MYIRVTEMASKIKTFHSNKGLHGMYFLGFGIVWNWQVFCTKHVISNLPIYFDYIYFGQSVQQFNDINNVRHVSALVLYLNAAATPTPA